MSINKFLTDFNYWLITEEGMYYRELLAAWFALIFFLLVIVADLIFAFYKKNADFIIIAVLFGYLAFKKIKKIRKLYKDKAW